MRTLWILVLCVLIGCSHSVVPAQRITLPPLFIRTGTISIYPELPVSDEGDWVLPLEQGDRAPLAGIMMSESRALRFAYNDIELKRLKISYEQDAHVWEIERRIIQHMIREKDMEIERLQPTWWDKHAWSVVSALTLLASLGFVSALKSI